MDYSDSDLESSSDAAQAGRWQQWCTSASVAASVAVVKEIQMSPTDNCLQVRR